MKYIEWGSDIHAPKDDIEKLYAIKSLCDEKGILCSSYGTYFRIGQDNKDEIIEYIKSAKILGTNVIRVWCGIKNSQSYDDKAILENCVELKKILILSINTAKKKTIIRLHLYCSPLPKKRTLKSVLFVFRNKEI